MYLRHLIRTQERKKQKGGIRAGRTEGGIMRYPLAEMSQWRVASCEAVTSSLSCNCFTELFQCYHIVFDFPNFDMLIELTVFVQKISDDIMYSS